MVKFREQETTSRPRVKMGKLPKGYREMVERPILENGTKKVVTTFEEEEHISDVLKASDLSLSSLQMSGENLAERKEMPKFFKINLFTNSAQEALNKLQDQLDYLQSEAQIEKEKSESKKTPLENLKTE